MTLWLERKYLNMVLAYLPNSKWKNETLLNHSCPYCGDSETNSYKARGYHFVVEQSYIYKCHNCGVSKSSVNFLKDNFAETHKEYLKEWLKETGRGKKRPQKMLPSHKFRFTPQTNLLNTTVHKICEDAWKVDESSKYLSDRMIPETSEIYYIDSSQKLAEVHTKYRDRVLGSDPRIVLPFYKDGNLIGLTGRAINDSKLRYLTMRFDEETPLIYNIDKVDTKKTVFVTEGPIDSLFLPNSIAVGGSDFSKLDNKLKKNAILIYDNEPRNTQILKKINSVIDDGWSVCIWNTKQVKGLKDINDMVRGGLSVDQIVETIKNNTHSGLQAKLKLKEYKC